MIHFNGVEPDTISSDVLSSDSVTHAAGVDATMDKSPHRLLPKYV